jgi:hypothetical protein
MRVVVGIAVCTLLTACNLAFDLDETISVDAAIADFDRDGVADSRDNCPTIANGDQLNVDTDGFGDACDACPQLIAASNHDDDDDGVGDACDPCPGIPEFGDDSDGDDVGDICDPDRTTTHNRRAAFDGFETLLPEWQATGLAWAASADAAAPAEVLPQTDGGLSNAALSIAAPWYATIGIRSLKPWMPGEQIGIEASVDGHRVRCRAKCDGSGACSADYLVDGVYLGGYGPVFPRPTSRLKFSISATNVITCGTEGSLSTTLSVQATGTATFAVVGSPNIQVSYFELVQ